MQLSINLSSTLRIAIVVLVVVAVVFAIHLLTRSEKLHARTLTLLCALALLLGWACLFAVSHGRPDPRELEGFEPFSTRELSAAGEAMEDAVALEYLDAADASGVRLVSCEMSFVDGEFSHMAFTAAFSGGTDSWTRHIDITEDGRAAIGERALLLETVEGLPAVSDVASALEGLETAGMLEHLGLPGDGAATLTVRTVPAAEYVMDGEPVPGAEYYTVLEAQPAGSGVILLGE